jgi:hypothetical protein
MNPPYIPTVPQHQRPLSYGRVIGRIGPAHARESCGALGLYVDATDYLYTQLKYDLLHGISRRDSQLLNKHLLVGPRHTFTRTIVAGVWQAQADDLNMIIRARRKTEILRAIAAAHVAGLPHVGLVAVCDAARHRLSIFWLNKDSRAKGAAGLERYLAAELPASYQPPNHVAVLAGAGE